MVRIYTKLPLSITDQVALLKSRGLQFVDEVAAEKLLSEVCYFRFVQYLRPMEADKIVHSFKPNSKFEDAVALYDFDTQLRNGSGDRYLTRGEHFLNKKRFFPQFPLPFRE